MQIPASALDALFPRPTLWERFRRVVTDWWFFFRYHHGLVGPDEVWECSEEEAAEWEVTEWGCK